MSASLPDQVTKETLFAALRRAWSADTSAARCWSPDNPALGQCAVTALLIQEHLGGALVKADVGGVSHYWNRFQDEDIDLTRDQFPQFKPKAAQPSSRRYVLSYPETRNRYAILKARVKLLLGRGEDGEVH